MIRDSIYTPTTGNPATTQPQPTAQQAMARAAFYAHVLALVDALEPTPTGGLYRRCYRKDGTRIDSLAEWVEAVEAGEVSDEINADSA